MKFGDIFLIRFPQTDLKNGKLRPALVVALAPGRYGDVLIALISSRTYQAIPGFDEIIDSSDADFDSSGLKVSSVIRLARLATVSSSIINARLGSISNDRLMGIKQHLIHWLQS